MGVSQDAKLHQFSCAASKISLSMSSLAGVSNMEPRGQVVASISYCNASSVTSMYERSLSITLDGRSASSLYVQPYAMNP